MKQHVANASQLKFSGTTAVNQLEQLQTTLILTDDAESTDVVITQGEIATINFASEDFSQPHGFISTLHPSRLQLQEVV